MTAGAAARPRTGAPLPTLHLAAMQPSRSFIDGQGVQWRVSERPVRRTPTEPARACLFFEAPHIIRRVCEYPTDWRTLTDVELERLSWRL